MNFECIKNKFKTINGQFFPGQMSSRLYMDEEKVSEKYLVAFHERFHYLQCIFTPYGHLKWATFRSVTADVVEAWKNLTVMMNKEKKIPVFEYINDGDMKSMQILATIYFQDFVWRFSNLMDGIDISNEELELFKIDKYSLLPQIQVDGKKYILNGLDVIESFAKFEEALLGYFLEEKDMNEIINPDILSPRYYMPLYYFIDEIGMDRLYEFPIVCELALAFSKLPKYNDEASLHNNHPGWRFVKIVQFIKEHNVEQPDIFSDESFWNYTNEILKGCNFDSWDELWKSAEEYEKENDLSMSEEMMCAIEYKKAHPWCLSYSIANPKEFLSEEFDRFHPLFVITNNRVFYNVNHINTSELLFENEFQALALQICGHISQYNLYPDMLQCADNYFGIKSCKHWLERNCDGHLCKESKLPPTILDENDNIIDGCFMEIMLNILGTSIKEIHIGDMRQRYNLKEIANVIKTI